MKQKAILIGWDGAPWSYLNRLLADNKLPNLAGLMLRSARATLRSTIPPFTNIAWPAMFTGSSPQSTGIYDGTKTMPASYQPVPTNLTTWRGTAFWQWLNQQGRRVAILNVPMTYPAPKVDGYFVTGFDSPAAAKGVAYPEKIREQWADAGYPYDILESEIHLMASQNPHQPRGELERFVADWETVTRAQGKHAAWLWSQGDLDVLFVVLSGTDSINHRTRDFSQISRVYQAADAALGEILSVTDENTYLVLLSDHGSVPAYRYVSLVRALADKGWLRFQPQVASAFWQRLPGPAGKIMTRLWTGLGDGWKRSLSRPFLRWDPRLAAAYSNIDWSRTPLFARSSMGLLYANHVDRYPQGCVTPAQYPQLLAEARDYFLSLVDEAGKPLFARVHFGAEIYPKARPEDNPPDLILEPAIWSDHLITGYPTDPLVRPIPDTHEYGTHDPDGILVLSGPDIQTDHELDTASLIDVVPTLLALLDLPIPQEMEGAILHEAANRPLPVQYAESARVASGATSFTEKEAKEVMRRLEDLGYL